MKTAMCKDCGAPIRLVPWGKGYRWVAGDYGKPSWKCGNDPLHPVKTHEPVEIVETAPT